MFYFSFISHVRAALELGLGLLRVRVRVRVTVRVNMQFRLTNSQRYLVNAKPGTNHSTNPTNPNGNSKW